MSTEEFAEDVAAVASLAEPIRRDLYSYVTSQDGPVSRDQAAAALDLPRHTVKFHLDKLVDEGLLTVQFRRLSGLVGPGAGRPSKLYRRSDREVTLNLPDRDYRLAARIMAAAIEVNLADGTPILEATRSAARSAGTGAMQDTAAAAAESANRAKLAESTDPPAYACSLLSARGYEPRLESERIALLNCPFHALVQDHTELVCTMNLELVDSLVNQGRDESLNTRLDPADGRCCVVIDL